MLPSYTKPNIQSVQPGMTGAAPATPATPTGYAVGANPITASRGAVADMTRAPAMPANPQVQSQPGIPQAWQSQHYANNLQHLRSLYSAPPSTVGLGGLPQSGMAGQPQIAHAAPVKRGESGMTGNAGMVDQNDWRTRVAKTMLNQPKPVNNYTAPALPINAEANQRALAAKAQKFHADYTANHEKYTAGPRREAEAARAAKEAARNAALGYHRSGSEDRGSYTGDNEDSPRHIFDNSGG